MLVRPARPTSGSELPNQIDRGPTNGNDVPMGSVRCAFWGVCNSTKFQYPDSDPATVLLRALSSELGSVFKISAVSIEVRIPSQHLR